MFFFLFLLEMVLQINHLLVVYWQDNANQITTEDSTKLRILTLGESTTAEIQAQKGMSWPRQLETKLNTNSLTSRVYNMGAVSISTTSILERLPAQIELYKPQIVIAMMGNHDRTKLLHEEKSILSKIKILSLYWWLKNQNDIANIEPPLSRPQLIKNKDNSQLIDFLIELDLQKILTEVKIKTSSMSSKEYAQYLSSVAFYLKYTVKVPDSQKLQILYHLLKQSLETHYSVAGVIEEFTNTLIALQKYDECYLTAEKYIEAYHGLLEPLYSMFQQCARYSNNDDLAKWSDIFSFSQYSVGDFNQSAGGETKLNYQKIYKLLKANNIKLIIMQYPLCRVWTLKNIFLPDQKIKIIFVENFNNFSEELKTKKWDELFIDNYSKVFGHTTSYGSSLIADSAAAAVFKFGPTRPLRQ